VAVREDNGVEKPEWGEIARLDVVGVNEEGDVVGSYGLNRE
jgi:hypothetical protein